MTTTWDVIVVGAGIEGSATAYALAKRGQRTLLIEQFSLPHTRGSSHGHSRITRKAYEKNHYARMMIDAYKLWAELEAEAGEQLYVQSGLLFVSKSGSEVLHDTEMALRNIRSVYSSLDSRQMSAKFPQVRFDDTYAAVFDPEGGVLKADRCLRAFQTQFCRYGGVIRDGEPVLRVVSDFKKVQVTTALAIHSSRSVVLTAGPWTSKLTEPLALKLPLTPTRVVVWYWKQRTGTSVRGHTVSDGFPTLIAYAGSEEVYSTPTMEYPGLVKVAYHGGLPIDPDQRDDVPNNNTKYLDFVTKFVADHLPGLEPKPSISEACIYTLTPDEDFILDRHPKWTNIVIGAGFSGHGFKLSPIVGQVLADLATGRSSAHDLTPFTISRFADKKPSSKL